MNEQVRSFEENNASSREVLDPNETLPKFVIDEYDHMTWPGIPDERIKWRFYPENEEWPPVGRCDLYVEADKIHFDGIEIDESQRGKGMGLAIYIAAIEEAQRRGLPFVTQEAGQSEDAKRIWELLRDEGVARVEEEFVEAPELVNGRKKFYGKYVVDPVE